MNYSYQLKILHEKTKEIFYKIIEAENYNHAVAKSIQFESSHHHFQVLNCSLIEKESAK